MDKETIIEGNKLIAEFITGGKSARTAGGGRAYVINGALTKKDNLEFHSSWNDLMPVVEKIHALSVNAESINGITDNDIFRFSIFAPINDVWISVVAFITWYNTNSLTPKKVTI